MLSEEALQKLYAVRRTLHAHPELSGKEFDTQKRIMDFLSGECRADVSTVGHTGVLAAFDSGQPGPVVLVRGDIDALPIVEENDFAYRSKTEGVSHKCGHDGHTAILLGLGMLLTEQPVAKGKVILLFQPSEENGMGAQAVMSDPAFGKQEIDRVFALHNLPGFEKHDIVVRENEFTGNVKSIVIKLKGKTSHAAEPEHGINPSLAIAEILSYADRVTKNDPTADDFFLMTPVYMLLGEKAYGISAGYGEVHCTLRSWSTDLMETRCETIEEAVRRTAQAHRLTPDISWTQVFHACVNDPASVEMVRNAAAANELTVIERKHAFKWGEDFGLFTQHFSGAMFGIGAGMSTPALHNPDYDFPDDILVTGVNMFYRMIEQTS